MPSYSFNEHFFDVVDTEEKAYWLGFLWCDGYVGKRIRKVETKNGIKDRIEYNIKLSLMEKDKNHLKKFADILDSNYPIHRYRGLSAFGNTEYYECRLFITNIYFGKMLHEEYGICANRNDPKLTVNKIPYNLRRHFIRGVIDGDGSISKYVSHNEKLNKEEIKHCITITSNENLLEFIETHLYKEGITQTEHYKKDKRHKEENRDGFCRGLKFSGKNQFYKILNYLYEGSSVYLDRKYERYIAYKKEDRQIEL